MIITLAAQAFDPSILEDVKFYVILALLTAALIAIIVIFATWDKFKANNREEELSKQTFSPPEIIKVEQKPQNNKIIVEDIKVED
jgi:uncharacterized membrane protein YraQ (UPF0718 family)